MSKAVEKLVSSAESFLAEQMKQGKITKAVYETLVAQMKAQAEKTGRTNASTEESVLKYAELAKLSPENLAKVKAAIKSLDDSIATLDTLIGKVEIPLPEAVKFSVVKGAVGSPDPRWFCNLRPAIWVVKEFEKTKVKK